MLGISLRYALMLASSVGSMSSARPDRALWKRVVSGCRVAMFLRNPRLLQRARLDLLALRIIKTLLEESNQVCEMLRKQLRDHVEQSVDDVVADLLRE